jgi:hypothetical protein
MAAACESFRLSLRRKSSLAIPDRPRRVRQSSSSGHSSTFVASTCPEVKECGDSWGDDGGDDDDDDDARFMWRILHLDGNDTNNPVVVVDIVAVDVAAPRRRCILPYRLSRNSMYSSMSFCRPRASSASVATAEVGPARGDDDVDVAYAIRETSADPSPSSSPSR